MENQETYDENKEYIKMLIKTYTKIGGEDMVADFVYWAIYHAFNKDKNIRNIKDCITDASNEMDTY